MNDHRTSTHRECLADRLCGFVRTHADRLRRDGAVLGLSGGLDSATAACICARALGPSRVLGLIMPERESAEKDATAAVRVAEWLGVRTETVDISDQLEALGAYDFALSSIPGPRLKSLAIRAGERFLRAYFGAHPYVQSGAGPAGRVLAGAAAHFKAKHRVRMVTAAYQADRQNLLLVGAANRTEKMTGLFCKFGIDHCADIMPLYSLYRDQVLRLAEHLGVPEDIRSRPPDPGFLPGVGDKYDFFLRVPAEAIDDVLRALEAGAEPEAVAARLDLSAHAVRELKRAVEMSWHARHPSLEPELEIAP